MDYNGVNPKGGEAHGLENQLRNMILTNQPQDQAHSPSSSQAEPATAGGPQTPKTAKKRLNQAQRRQMSSQLNVAVDTRAQPPPDQTGHFGRSTHGQHWQQHQPPHYQQRFHHENAGRGGHGLSSSPRQHHQGHWNNYQRQPAQGRGGFHHHHQPPHQQHGPAPGPQAAPHHPGWRQGPGPVGPRRPLSTPEQLEMQAAMLDKLWIQVVPNSEIDMSEISDKENFRRRIEDIVRNAVARYEYQTEQHPDFPPLSVELKCFGSLSSGFATKASDMDLALLSPLSVTQPDAKDSPIPRLLEKALLDAGIGARLLSKTRVPIIKLCERPPEVLFKRLLAYREKWEKGEVEEHHDEHEEEEEEHEEAGEKKEFEIPSTGSKEPQKFHLKQGPSTSLSGYHGLAKRVLRKIGGRELKGPHNKLSDDEWEILNRLCEAYIQGLSDATLRQRLQRYQSLSFDPIQGVPDLHSLGAVAAQAEGEHIFQIWETSTLNPESGQVRLKNTENMGIQPDEAYRTWKMLQSRITYGTDPATFERQVQQAVDALRKIPAVQAILLEQSQDETPSQYHARAKKVLHLLRQQYQEDNGVLEKVFINHYIHGIRPKEVRVPVEQEYSAATSKLNLNAIARKHKSLQLVKDLTRALDKELIPAEQKPDVLEYIDILKVPLRAMPLRHAASHPNFDFVIPVTTKKSDLVARIKTMPDPSTLAPNQPKSKYQDMLEFPKTGAGVQCDINFSAHLALENTLLLRCYSHTDPRVRPMILFVKHWAKMRGINSGYRGTLSSYGYVLMVLHYLVNVVRPFVCPNLQQLAPPPPPPHLAAAAAVNNGPVVIKGYNVQFWRNEEEIKHLAALRQLTHNNESIGHLLRGFFEYYAQTGTLHTIAGATGFEWGREVVSLRTQGGILTKHAKGWVGAKTVYQTQNEGTAQTEVPGTSPETGDKSKPRPANKGGDGVREVRLRYLFAIEDPFELDHNVARTVTHNGIVSIRDEFRRAWRIIKGAGEGRTDEDLLKDVSKQEETSDRAWFPQLLDEIHGPVVFDDEQ